nr:MAG: hypothetical protein AM325_08045 [Candidatus Thorarchaeota archaeon SMTZ1-45]
MAKLSFFTILGIVIVTLLFISAIPQVTAGLEGFMISQDSNEPDIWEWGIEGEPELGQGFDVWANVSDQDDDLKNVTVQVIGPNMTINNLMTFNGTFYTGFVPAFPNDGTFSVRIRAYDLENNTRTSTLVYIDFESNPTPTIDPSVTMPIVVGSSVGFMVFVVGLALLYDRRTVPDLEGL